MTTTTNKRLRFRVGYAGELRFALVDETGEDLPLGDVEYASATFYAETAADVAALTFETGSGGTLAINATEHTLVATITEAESEGLTPGSYLVVVWLHYGATDARHDAQCYAEVVL